LLTPKVSKITTPLNAIVVEHECDLIIDVQCNKLMLHKMLVDGWAKVNVMIILAIKYLRLKIARPALVTVKMANKQVVKLKGVNNSVIITIMKVITIMDFHVVL
jgi:hypothetical protein